MHIPLKKIFRRLVRSAIIVVLVLALLSLFSAVQEAWSSEVSSNYQSMPAFHKMPPLVAKWDRPPTVIVCDIAPVEEWQLRSALAFWGRQNFKFGTVEFKRNTTASTTACDSSAPVGHIVIHLAPKPAKENPSQKPTTLAQTHFYVDNNTKKIRWAIIKLHTAPIERVLEHEIGHALGFLHYNKAGHLMHESQPLGGWDTDGLQK
jgi:hypothetical protein